MPNAFVIGIDKYWNEQSHLDRAVDDAIGFAEWLVTSGAVAASKVHLFIEPRDASAVIPPTLAGVQLTRSASYAAIVDEMETVADGLTADDERFYFYFAGHGLQWTDGEIPMHLLCCADFYPAKSSRGRNHLTVESVLRLFRARPVPVQFFFVDACRNFPKGRNFKPQSIFFDAGKELNVDQLLLRATSAGEEVEDGSFTPVLLEMLGKGEGSCKAYDREANAYIVTWDSLCTRLMAGPFPRIREARPHATKSHMQNANPELCRFPADHFQATVDVRLVSPKPTDGTLKCRPCHDPHAGTEHPVAASAAYVEVAQGDYVMEGLADAVAYFPRDALVRIYESRSTVDLYPPGAIAAPQIVHTDRDGQRRDGADVAEPRKSRGLSAPNDDQSRLTLSTADPLTQLLVYRAGGTLIACESGQLSLELPPGAYGLAARGAADGRSSLDIALGAGEELSFALELPDTATPLTRALAAATGRPIENGLFYPFGAEAAAVALADAPAVLAHTLINGAFAPQTPALEHDSIVAFFIDESDGADSRQRTAHLWEQYERNDGVRAEMSPIFGLQAFAWSSDPLPDTYWFEVRNRRAGERSGFKQAVWIPPGHLLLHITHRRSDRTMAIYQIALCKGREAGAIHDAVRHSMWLQKAMETSVPAPAWPIVESLIADEWFEPIAALLVATALAAEAPDAAQKLLDRLAERAPGSMDARVLVKRLGREGGFDIRSPSLRTPILSENLHALVAGVRAERQFGRERRWLDEKAKQDAGHPLWLIRKEDDKKGSKIPLAISGLRAAAKLLRKSRDPIG